MLKENLLEFPREFWRETIRYRIAILVFSNCFSIRFSFLKFTLHFNSIKIAIFPRKGLNFHRLMADRNVAVLSRRGKKTASNWLSRCHPKYSKRYKELQSSIFSFLPHSFYPPLSSFSFFLFFSLSLFFFFYSKRISRRKEFRPSQIFRIVTAERFQRLAN